MLLAELCPPWRASSVRGSGPSSGGDGSPSHQPAKGVQSARLGTGRAEWAIPSSRMCGTSSHWGHIRPLGQWVLGPGCAAPGRALHTALQLRIRILLSRPWLLQDSSMLVSSLAAGWKNKNPDRTF